MGEIMDEFQRIIKDIGRYNLDIPLQRIESLIEKIERDYMKKPDYTKCKNYIVAELHEENMDVNYDIVAKDILKFIGITPPEPEYCEVMKDVIKNGYVTETDGHFLYMTVEKGMVSPIYRCPFCQEGKNCIAEKGE